MKKTLVIVLTLTLVLLFAAAPVYAAENKLWTNNTMTVFKGKVTVDGKIDDIWKHAPEFHMMYDAQGASAEKLGGKYTGPYANYGKILWDGNMVYILCYAQRDEIVLNADFSTWNKDGVELYIDEGNEKLDTAYDDNDSLSRILADGTVASSKKKVTVAAGSIAGGYLLEMSYEFESVTPKAGRQLLRLRPCHKLQQGKDQQPRPLPGLERSRQFSPQVPCVYGRGNLLGSGAAGTGRDHHGRSQDSRSRR